MDENEDKTQEAIDAHHRHIDEILASFLFALQRCIELAQHRLITYLLKSLRFDAGVLTRTAANQRVLRRLPRLWNQALDEAHLEAVVTNYTDTFPQQITEFQRILKTLNERAKNPLPFPKFTNDDLSYFGALQQTAAADMAGLVESAGQTLSSRSIFAAGGISFKDLAAFIIEKTGASQSRAAAFAETALMVHFRTVAAVGFERIQDKLKTPLRFAYRGPLDSITRPFCRHVLEMHRDFTKAEIDQMDSGQGNGTVLYVCGGWRCRHSWVMSLKQSIQ